MNRPRLIQTYLVDGTLEGIRSVGHKGNTVIIRSVNAWTTWKNSVGETMDQVMRRGE